MALVGDVYCVFATFPCGILGHVWYLIVLIPDYCLCSYFLNFICFYMAIDTAYFLYMGLIARKPVFRVSDKVRLKPVSTATETS